MAIVVSLRDVVQALDLPGEGCVAYLNPATGEIVTVSDEDQRLVEDDVDPEKLPDWQQEMLPKVRAVLESDRFLALPDRFEIHEWGIMERFAEARTAPEQREELLDAIHGSGAFRMFRASIRRLGVEEEWHRFRDDALETIAKDWLEAHGIAYK